jgi:hypothetical protein
VAINIPTSGKVFVRSFSSVQAVQGKDGDNIIKLESGKVDGECGIDKPGLTINTIPASINVLGGNFTASLTPMGELRVKTSNGTVELKSSYESSVIVRDHICEVKPGGNIGVPYHINADSSIIAALNKISFGEKSIADFDFVLKNATRTDGISLLYLLKETQNPNERATIFARLNELYPVVPGVTQGGIIRLDQTMFDTWRDDIEWQL